MAVSALREWEACIDFCRTHCPPNDENLVCFATHAALSALAAASTSYGAKAAGTEAGAGAEAEEYRAIAAKHAQLAVQTHAVAFGGDLAYFRARYAEEMQTAPLARELGAQFWERAQQWQ